MSTNAFTLVSISSYQYTHNKRSKHRITPTPNQNERKNETSLKKKWYKNKGKVTKAADQYND